MHRKKVLTIESSSGNVFADLGSANAGEHMVNAGLVVKINKTIQPRGLTQAAVAQLMGIGLRTPQHHFRCGSSRTNRRSVSESENVIADMPVCRKHPDDCLLGEEADVD